MLFNFELRPLKDIDDPALQWYWLTDGWYWLNVGADELFRYTDRMLATYPPEVIGKVLPYVDYYVVELWEDIQVILPDVLEPIPASVLKYYQPGADAEELQEKASNSISEDTKPGRAELELYFNATGWFGNRALDRGYLIDGQQIWFWTDGIDLTITWDGHDAGEEIGFPRWTTLQGKFSMPLQAFIDDLRAFDRRLMVAMEDRIHVLRTDIPFPHLSLDSFSLEEEQRIRIHEMENAFEKARQKPPTDWDKVIEAIEYFERG